MALTPLEQKFKTEICERGSEIDPDEELDWNALSVGWALANGLSVDEAHDFARIVGYTYHYWT